MRERDRETEVSPLTTNHCALYIYQYAAAVAESTDMRFEIASRDSRDVAEATP